MTIQLPDEEGQPDICGAQIIDVTVALGSALKFGVQSANDHLGFHHCGHRVARGELSRVEISDPREKVIAAAEAERPSTFSFVVPLARGDTLVDVFCHGQRGYQGEDCSLKDDIIALTGATSIRPGQMNGDKKRANGAEPADPLSYTPDRQPSNRPRSYKGARRYEQQAKNHQAPFSRHARSLARARPSAPAIPTHPIHHEGAA